MLLIFNSTPSLGSMLIALLLITVFLLPSKVRSKFASASKASLLLILKSLAAPTINRGAVISVDFTGISFLVKYRASFSLSVKLNDQALKVVVISLAVI